MSCKCKDIDIIREQISNVDEGEVVFTVNMKVEDLKYLCQDEYGNKFFSLDKDATGNSSPAVKQKIHKLYAKLGIPIPDNFTSVAVHTSVRSNLANMQSFYGAVTVVLRLESIKNSMKVFNGDVKDLAECHLESAKTIDFPDQEALLKQIAILHQNQHDKNFNGQGERLHGKYVEARVLRPITLEDVQTIYVPPAISLKCF